MHGLHGWRSIIQRGTESAVQSWVSTTASEMLREHTSFLLEKYGKFYSHYAQETPAASQPLIHTSCRVPARGPYHIQIASNAPVHKWFRITGYTTLSQTKMKMSHYKAFNYISLVQVPRSLNCGEGEEEPGLYVV